MLHIGWAQTDITPERPVVIAGQFYARRSEGVLDRLTATAWAIESTDDHAVMVSCDLVTISDDLLRAVRGQLDQVTGLDVNKVILNATHTHTGPEIRIPSPYAANVSNTLPQVELDVMPVEEYVAFATERIAQAVRQAWNTRAPGGIAYGMGHAVIGRNRRWVDEEGRSTMYGLHPKVYDRFRHIEGYEDHSVNLLATYDHQGGLTGLVVNIACPSQAIEGEFSLSADYWHETREELRKRYGAGLYILPQCSTAGDLSPHLLYDRPARDRMLKLTGRTIRQEIAHRIAAAVDDVLPAIQQDIRSQPVLRHAVDTVQIPMNLLTAEDVQSNLEAAEMWRQRYEERLQTLQADPDLYKEPRWYVKVTDAFRRMNWHANVANRYKLQQDNPNATVELHTLRIGEIVLSTNPYEYYLDYGIQIKVRSPALQTFLVQLSGPGTYVPSPRSVRGGGYGSVPASNAVGPEGGQQLADETVRAIRALFD